MQIGVIISNVKIVLCTYKIISSDTFNGISVDNIQGIDAEKNKIDDTETTAITNFVTSGALTTKREGKNISAIPTDTALAARSASGNCNSPCKWIENITNPIKYWRKLCQDDTN